MEIEEGILRVLQGASHHATDTCSSDGPCARVPESEQRCRSRAARRVWRQRRGGEAARRVAETCMDKPPAPRRRTRRIPLAELDAEEIAERSVLDDMDKVCLRLSQLNLPRHAPARRRTACPKSTRKVMHGASTEARKRTTKPEFTVFEDPCAVHGLVQPMGRQTRAMTAAYTHDDKENQQASIS